MSAHPPGTCTRPCPDYGRCHCGCGAKTNPARYTSKTHGYVKGQPHQFVVGHHASEVRAHVAGKGTPAYRRRVPRPVRSIVAGFAEGREPTDRDRELLAAWVWHVVMELKLGPAAEMIEAYREHRATCGWQCPWSERVRRRRVS